MILLNFLIPLSSFMSKVASVTGKGAKTLPEQWQQQRFGFSPGMLGSSIYSKKSQLSGIYKSTRRANKHKCYWKEKNGKEDMRDHPISASPESSPWIFLLPDVSSIISSPQWQSLGLDDVTEQAPALLLPIDDAKGGDRGNVTRVMDMETKCG